MLSTSGFGRVRKAQERDEPFQRLYIAGKQLKRFHVPLRNSHGTKVPVSPKTDFSTI
jgi:hypothetical protein